MSVPHCRNGHAKTADNLYINSRGVRVCRTCRLAQAKAYNARKRVIKDIAKYRGKRPTKLLTRDKAHDYKAGLHTFGPRMTCLGCGKTWHEHQADGLDCPTPVPRRQRDVA